MNAISYTVTGSIEALQQFELYLVTIVMMNLIAQQHLSGQSQFPLSCCHQHLQILSLTAWMLVWNALAINNVAVGSLRCTAEESLYPKSTYQSMVVDY